jgi:hypothetical protein
LVFGKGDTIILKKIGGASQETEKILTACQEEDQGTRRYREDVIREIRAVRKEQARRAG